jgi:hypothetical protein
MMQSHDLLIGVQLAALCARNELRFLWWPVLHRARTTTGAADRFQSRREPAHDYDPRREAASCQ